MVQEQISFKKKKAQDDKSSLKVSKLQDSRRKLLQEYYQLDENNGEQSDTIHMNPSSNGRETEHNKNEIENPLTSSSTGSEINNGLSNENGNIEKIDDINVNKLTFKEIVHIHNTLTGHEQEINNLIKSTIYDNYYELIRVGEALGKISDTKQSDSRKENVHDLLKDLQSKIKITD